MAFPWFATLLTRDPFLIGLVAFAGRLPWLLLAVPVGVLTDRADRQRLIMRADAFRAAIAVGVVGLILTLSDPPRAEPALAQIAALSALAFLLGCAEVLRDNAAQTLMPSVVAPADLERANGTLWTVETVVGRFLGPPLAGFLIAWTLPAPFLLDAALSALAALFVWCIALPRRRLPRHESWHAETCTGLVWLWSRPIPRRLTL